MKLPSQTDPIYESRIDLAAVRRLRELEDWHGLATLLQARSESYDGVELALLRAETALRTGDPHKARSIASRELKRATLGTEHTIRFRLVRSVANRTLGHIQRSAVDASLALAKLKNERKRNVDLLIEAHKQLGVALASGGDSGAGKEQFDLALSLTEESTNLALRAEVQNCLGIVHARLGNSVAARVHFDNAVVELSKLSRPIALADTYVNIGNLNIETGDLAGALAALRQCRDLARSAGYLRAESIANMNLGDVYVALGQPEEALRSYQEAKSLASNALEFRHICCANTGIGVAKRLLGSFDEARSYLEQAAYESARMGLGHENAAANLELAVLEIQSGSPVRAKRLLSWTVRRCRATSSTVLLRRALFFVCVVYLREDDEVKLGSTVRRLQTAAADPSSRPLAAHDLAIAEDLVDHITQLGWPPPILRRIFRERSSSAKSDTDEKHHKLDVKVLGGSRVTVNGVEIVSRDWMSRKAQAVFIALACHPTGKSTEELADLLWPESEGSRGRGALYSAIHRARNAVGADVILFHSGKYLINPDANLTVDLERFFELSALGESNASRPEDKICALQDADQLYEGEFWPDSVADWTIPIRRRAENQALTNLARLALLLESRNDIDLAAATLRKIIRIDPTNSQAHANLVRLLMQSGRSVEAKTAFGTFKTMMKDDPGAGHLPDFRSLTSGPPSKHH